MRRFDHESLLPLALGLLGGCIGVLFLAERLAGIAGTVVTVGAVILGAIGLVMLLAHFGFTLAPAQRRLRRATRSGARTER